MPRAVVRGIFVISVVFISLLSTAAHTADMLVLGVHPFLPAMEIVDRFTPLADYLSRKTGAIVTIRVSQDYDEHIEKIGRDELDIAFMGPASYVKMVEEFGRKPLLARLEVGGKTTFNGVIIVRDDSPVRTLSDLKGRRFAFGDPSSTMSHLVPRYMLWEAGVTLKDLSGYEFMYNHNNVALGVLVGEFDAGAVKREVFDSYEARGLRALAWTPDIAEHVFVAGSRMSPDKVEVLRKLLYALRDSEEGRAAMTPIRPDLTGMVPADDGDFKGLRKMLRTLKGQGVDY